MLPTTRRRHLSLPRRAGLLEELLDATPKSSAYTMRRSVILRHLEICQRALAHTERTNEAKFFMSTRRAFSVGYN